MNTPYDPANAASTLVATVCNLTAANTELNRRLALAEAEIARLTAELGRCNCSGDAPAVAVKEFKPKPKQKPEQKPEQKPKPKPEPKPKPRPANFKTVLCRNFMENGECSYGDRCHFAHGDDDLY